MGLRAVTKVVGRMRRMEKKLRIAQGQSVLWKGGESRLQAERVIRGAISWSQSGREGRGSEGRSNEKCVCGCS